MSEGHHGEDSPDLTGLDELGALRANDDGDDGVELEDGRDVHEPSLLAHGDQQVRDDGEEGAQASDQAVVNLEDTTEQGQKEEEAEETTDALD